MTRFGFPFPALFPAVAAVVLVGALAGCAGEDPPPAADSAPAATSAPAAPEQPTFTGAQAEVEEALRGYNQAIADGDFASACALNAPETNEALLAAITEAGAEASTCEEAFALVFADPQAMQLAQQVAATIQIQDITVEGERATVTWTTGSESVSNGMAKIDGEWRLLTPGG